MEQTSEKGGLVMSYDIYLTDPVSRDTIELPIKHIMTGGTFAADYDEKSGKFYVKAIAEAWLNITYNYSRYYREALEEHLQNERENKGIRILYGKTGAESLLWIGYLINGIKEKYPKLETNDDYWEPTPGNAIRPLYQLKAMAELRPDGIWEGD